MWSTRRLIGKLGRGARNEFISTEVVNPDLHKIGQCVIVCCKQQAVYVMYLI